MKLIPLINQNFILRKCLFNPIFCNAKLGFNENFAVLYEVFIKNKYKVIAINLLILFLIQGDWGKVNAEGRKDTEILKINPPYDRLIPLHQKKKSPGPYDWMAVNNEEGQTFEQFVQSNPRKPNRKKEVIYIFLLGDFDPLRQEIIEKTARFMEAYFMMPVKMGEAIPLKEIPPEAQRIHPLTQDHQILTTYVIEKILIPRKTQEAFCTIAFTASDLWPGEGWNFVFGQASMEDRVGVWSIYRNGDPLLSKSDYHLCLKRTIKTGTHEVGHTFGLPHCIYFECNMNGSNHRKESDERPLWLCPVCLNKICWILNIEPREWLSRVKRITQQVGFEEENVLLRKSLESLN